MNIADIKNEQALDTLADVLEPVSRLMDDKAIKEAARESYLKALKVALKTHKKDVMCILAAFDGEPVETYEISVTQIPLKMMELYANPDLRRLFTWQGQKTESTSSGSATESTEGEEQSTVSSRTTKQGTKSTKSKE